MIEKALEFSNSESLKNFLDSNGIDTDIYGTGNAKDVDDLFSEIDS